MVKSLPANAEDTSSIPGWGRFPREGKGYPLQYILVWRIPWTEEPGELYTLWGHKELDMTQQLSHTPFLKSFCLPETLKYLQIFVIHLLSSAFLFPAVWAIVPPGSLLALHSFNTLLLHMVSVTGIVPSPGDTETSKTIYHWRKEKHFEISFFLRFILFFLRFDNVSHIRKNCFT